MASLPPFRLPSLPDWAGSLPNPLAALPAVINHLLKPEAWARARLAAHAGKVARFEAEPFRLDLAVTAEGYVERPADSAGTAPAVRVVIPLAAVPGALLPGQADALQSLVRAARIDGDADFAHAISAVAGNLRWDIEEDLSKLVGDAAAVQLVAGARALVREVQTARTKLAGNVAEYFLEEQPQLVRPRQIDALGAAVRTLRDDLARLDKRVALLESRTAGRAR